jgi:hypothetical protein
MKNPYTKLNGYKHAVHDFHNGWLVVFDRRDIEDYSSDREQNRWLVKHMETGKTKTYRTLSEARIEALACARSIHSWNHWWLKEE